MQEWFKETQIPDFSLHVGAVTGWRLRAKLAVQGTASAPLFGLYEEGSHKVVEIPLCRVHNVVINRGVAFVSELVRRYELTVYDEKTKKGDLRYLQFIVERSSGRLHVSFVLNVCSGDTERLGVWKKALQDLWSAQPVFGWHSFAVNLNTSRNNVIFSSRWEFWFGNSFFCERFLGVDVCFQPSSFSQANLDQFERLLQTIKRWVPVGARVLEFYAGVGAIGLTLVEKSKNVCCCEINPLAENSFKESLRFFSVDLAQKISWHSGPSKAFSGWLQEADVIIVDPPRKGLEPEFLESLLSYKGPASLIYMSCGWESFKQNAKQLCGAGWKIKNAEGHLFFPGCNHVETLVLFDRH